MSAKERYHAILEEVAERTVQSGRSQSDVKVITVSKTWPLQDLLPIYQEGCRYFGENRVMEALEKSEQGPSDVLWHFIGPLQKNKVNKVIGVFDCLHSIQNVELAEKISTASLQKGLTTNILLQVNTSGELSKQGFTEESCRQNIEALWKLPGIKVKGLMTMAPFTQDEKIVRHCFAGLRNLRDILRQDLGQSDVLVDLSMGMSNDYLIAIDEGATLLRLGTCIFGKREVQK